MDDGLRIKVMALGFYETFRRLKSAPLYPAGCALSMYAWRAAAITRSRLPPAPPVGIIRRYTPP